MRRAVLVAASRFEDPAFPPLQFALRDAERLKEILDDPALGGFDQVVMLANPPGNAARIGLERTARACDPGDVLLFYFSGHGKLDRDGSLALAMSDSDTTVLGATSLVSDELKRILNLSKASQKIMILDCCYSGAVGVVGFKGALGDSIENLAQNFRGSFLLAASQRFERAWENEEKGAGALTNALVEGVRTGAASKSGRDEITLSDIASYVKRTVPQDSPQLPEYWDSGGIGDVVFSRTPLLFDSEWARKVKAMVTRYVSTQVFDEDFADTIRSAIRMREDPAQSARMKLLDRLLRREVQISTFVTIWPTLAESASAAAPEPPSAEPPKAEISAIQAGPAEDPRSVEADPEAVTGPGPKDQAAVPPVTESAALIEEAAQPLPDPPPRSREYFGDRPLVAEGPAEPFWQRPAVIVGGLFLLLTLLVVLFAIRPDDTVLNTSLGNATVQVEPDPVTITAAEDVFVHIYEPDGHDLYLGTLRAGQTFQVPPTAVSPMIRTDRPEAVRVSVGATAIAPLGRAGTPIHGVSLKPSDLLARSVETPGPSPASRSDEPAADVPAKAEPTLPEKAKAETPPPRPTKVRPAPVGPYIAFFDWQKSEVTPMAAAILDNAIASIRPLQRGDDEVLVLAQGFTDEPENAVAVSRARAQAVKRYMVSHGIPAGAIIARGNGVSRALVDTPDGVREPQNRRVEITVSIRSPQ